MIFSWNSDKILLVSYLGIGRDAGDSHTISRCRTDISTSGNREYCLAT
jgi:hypothetical protein